eukprot:4306279-Prymnesium_polylepis.1
MSFVPRDDHALSDKTANSGRVFRSFVDFASRGSEKPPFTPCAPPRTVSSELAEERQHRRQPRQTKQQMVRPSPLLESQYRGTPLQRSYTHTPSSQEIQSASDATQYTQPPEHAETHSDSLAPDVPPLKLSVGGTPPK